MDSLARLVAIEEIRQLKARYFRFMDTRDWEAMAQVFCSDAVWDCTEGYRSTPVGGTPTGPVGPVKRGRAAIMEWVTDGLANNISVHHGHCHEVIIDSETEAHGFVAMEDVIRGGDRTSPVLHGAGHYRERYRVEDGAWRISEIKLTRLFNDIAPVGLPTGA